MGSLTSIDRKPLPAMVTLPEIDRAHRVESLKWFLLACSQNDWITVTDAASLDTIAFEQVVDRLMERLEQK